MGRGGLNRRTKVGINTKLHAFCDSRGCPLNQFFSAGQVSYHKGASRTAMMAVLRNSLCYRHLLVRNPDRIGKASVDTC